MEYSKIFLKITLITFLGLLLITCQEEEQFVSNQDTELEMDTPQLKSATASDYLLELIETIESLVADGTISAGKGNALISKIENAIKSSLKGNTNAVNGQLGALINEIENLVDRGILDDELGESLIKETEYGTFLINGYPIITEGLIAYYPFNGNTFDESGNNNHGESENVTFLPNRVELINSSAFFNGESLIQVPGIGQAGGSFSIALWYKTISGGSILATDKIFMGADDSYNQFLTSWQIYIESIGTATYSPAGNPAYFDDTWHHVVVTHDATEERIITYFDGSVRHNRPNSGYFEGNLEDIYLGMVVKEYPVRYTYVEPYFIGSIDDVYFFDRALNSTEVEQLFYFPN